MIPETKILLEKLCFLVEFSQKTGLKDFSRNRRSYGHSRDDEGFQEKHVVGKFPGEESCDKLQQRSKPSKKIALHLKTTLAAPPIYDRVYTRMLSTASPGNPVGITKLSSLLFFVQPDQSFLEVWTKLEETCFFLDNFWQKIHEKSSLAVETCNKTHCCSHRLNSSSIQVIRIALSMLSGLIFRQSRKTL